MPIPKLGPWVPHMLRERESYLRNLLVATHGNLRECSKIADVNRRTIYDWIREHEISPLYIRQLRKMTRGV